MRKVFWLFLFITSGLCLSAGETWKDGTVLFKESTELSRPRPPMKNPFRNGRKTLMMYVSRPATDWLCDGVRYEGCWEWCLNGSGSCPELFFSCDVICYAFSGDYVFVLCEGHDGGRFIAVVDSCDNMVMKARVDKSIRRIAVGSGGEVWAAGRSGRNVVCFIVERGILYEYHRKK